MTLNTTISFSNYFIKTYFETQINKVIKKRKTIYSAQSQWRSDQLQHSIKYQRVKLWAWY